MMSPSSHPEPRALARSIEHALAEQFARTPSPASRQGIPALHVAGGRAVLVAARSPHSAAVGVGMAGPVRPAELDRIEAHLGQGGGAVRVELNPFCEPSLALELGRRGYRVEQYQLVWWRRPDPVPLPSPRVEVRPLRPGEEGVWSALFFHAFTGRAVLSESELQPGLALTRTEGCTCFLALEEGTPHGVGVASATSGVALLSGDGVVPAFRGRGLQLALIRARIAWAEARGCTVVTASTEPSTASQRNYEKAGFRCAYPKLVMVREPTPGGS